MNLADDNLLFKKTMDNEDNINKYILLEKYSTQRLGLITLAIKYSFYQSSIVKRCWGQISETAHISFSLQIHIAYIFEVPFLKFLIFISFWNFIEQRFFSSKIANDKKKTTIKSTTIQRTQTPQHQRPLTVSYGKDKERLIH